jgi:hypothetical protein
MHPASFNGGFMEFNQALQFVKQFQREHNLPTIKDALYELGAVAHKLPLDLYVAKDIVGLGHTSAICPTIAVGAIPANLFL